MPETPQQPGTYCPHCGYALDPGDRFCDACGKPLAPAGNAQPQPAQVTMTAATAAPETPQQPGTSCPHCGYALDPGDRFCDACGKPVAPADNAQPQPTTAAAPAATPAATPAASARPLATAVAPVAPARPLATAPAPVAPPRPTPPPLPGAPAAGISRAPVAPEAPAATDNRTTIDQLIRSIKKSLIGDSAPAPALAEDAIASRRQAPSRPAREDTPVLEVDCNREFQQGLSVNLRARLRLPASGPRQAKLCVRGCGFAGDNLGLDYCQILTEQHVSLPLDITVPWRPADSAPPGENLVTWELLYNGDRYEGTSKHDIMPDPACDQRLPGQVNFAINQGHAGDVKIGGGLFDDIRGDSTQERIRRNSQKPPAWQAVRLYRTTCFGPPMELLPPPAAAQCDKLSLCFNAHRLHLLAKDTISLGRNRDNDIMTRCYDSAINLDSSASRKISGEAHLIVSRDKHGAVAITDKGSMNGTTVDGTRLATATPHALQNGTKQQLGIAMLGNKSSALSLALSTTACDLPFIDSAYCAERFCKGVPCPGLFMERQDCVPENYAIVWCHLNLAACQQGWPDLTIWRIHDAFAWKTPDGGAGWLSPGSELPLPGGGQCKITTFCQFPKDI